MAYRVVPDKEISTEEIFSTLKDLAQRIKGVDEKTFFEEYFPELDETYYIIRGKCISRGYSIEH